MPDADGVKLEASWKAALSDEFSDPYMQELRGFLKQRMLGGAKVFPPPAQWFNALDSTPLLDVKVVILGQDPYHGPGQAHGLCFSVQPDVPVPPSLKNIYKELQSDIGMAIPTHGYLQSWAEQGVLLLNAVLTVEQGSAGAHQGKGWERFTDAVIARVNAHREGVVFLLWGSYAQKKAAMIDASKHLCLTAPHPSPLSAHRGFFGCKHFSQTNAYLASRGVSPIKWALPLDIVT